MTTTIVLDSDPDPAAKVIRWRVNMKDRWSSFELTLMPDGGMVGCQGGNDASLYARGARDKWDRCEFVFDDKSSEWRTPTKLQDEKALLLKEVECMQNARNALETLSRF